MATTFTKFELSPSQVRHIVKELSLSPIPENFVYIKHLQSTNPELIQMILSCIEANE